MSEIPPDYWACACIKRGRDRKMKSIKVHPPTTKVCRVCGCKKIEVMSKPINPLADKNTVRFFTREFEGTDEVRNDFGNLYVFACDFHFEILICKDDLERVPLDLFASQLRDHLTKFFKNINSKQVEEALSNLKSTR